MLAADLLILDVGHGNTSVATLNDEAVIVDCGYGVTLLDTLRERKIDTIDAVYISHADADHIAGAVALLTSGALKVKRIYVNPDASKGTKIWEDFRIALENSVTQKVEIVGSVHSATPVHSFGPWTFEVLGPRVGSALGGVGGKSMSGKKSSSNSMSVVLLVSAGGKPAAILPGDLDHPGLDDLLAVLKPVKVPILVFPHHGGMPTGSLPTFIAKLQKAFSPSYVAVSNSRESLLHPHQNVIANLKGQVLGMACTQLSQHCSSKALGDTGHLEPLPARGRSTNSCCAGSIALPLGILTGNISQGFSRHRQFVQNSIPGALCR